MTSLLLACALLLLSGAEAYQWGYYSGGCSNHYVYGVCELQPDPRAPVRVEGIVDMRQTITCSGDTHTEFRVRVRGLPQSSQYVERGFHVHEFADFSNGCTSAGSHYNPTRMVHGAPGDFIRHVGDLGNLETRPDGTIDCSIVDAQANLLGQYPIIGRSIVLHEKRDDLGMGGDEESLKTGNAGGRLACCEIKFAHGPPRY